MNLTKIAQATTTVEEFIQECLNQDIDYNLIFEYLTNEHKG